MDHNWRWYAWQLFTDLESNGWWLTMLVVSVVLITMVITRHYDREYNKESLSNITGKVDLLIKMLESVMFKDSKDKDDE